MEPDVRAAAHVLELASVAQELINLRVAHSKLLEAYEALRAANKRLEDENETLRGNR